MSLWKTLFIGVALLFAACRQAAPGRVEAADGGSEEDSAVVGGDGNVSQSDGGPPGCSVTVPRDPGFASDDVWQASGYAWIPTDAPGQDDRGAGVLPMDGVCAGDGFRQTVVPCQLPDPAQIRFSANVNCYAYEGLHCDANSVRAVGLGINGGWHGLRVPDHSRWYEFTLCLGERAYAGPLEIFVGSIGGDYRAAGCGHVPPGPGPDVVFDRVNIFPAEPGVCPVLGQVANGDFENGRVGWEQQEMGGTVVPGSGQNGTAGLVLDPLRSGGAGVSRNVSFPLSETLPSPALEMWISGREGSRLTAAADYSLFLGTADVGAQPSVHRICVPRWAQGTVRELHLTVWGHSDCAQTGELCDPQVLVDNVTLVSEPTCTDEPLLDGGFELNAANPLVNHGWFITRELPSAGEIVADPANARTGNAALHLAGSAVCRVAMAGTFFRIPEAQGNEGPALTFWYRAPVLTNARLRVRSPLPFDGGGQSSLDPAPDWSRHVVCLHPASAGQVDKLDILLDDLVGGACGDPFPEESVWLDDFEVGTDPTCPVQ